MIRYAITAGCHLPFLIRNRQSCPSGTPAAGDDSEQDTGFLPFPPPTSLLDQVRHLALQGVDYIQLREKHLPAGELTGFARQILELIRQLAAESACPTRLLINTRADVAAAVGADGVHLSAAPGALTPHQVRSLYRSIGLPAPIVSKSCHNLPEVRAAFRDQPDLILFSPIFGKHVDGLPVVPAAGLDALAAACALADPIPVLALGGVTQVNSLACLQSGAAGVAGIRLFQP